MSNIKDTLHAKREITEKTYPTAPAGGKTRRPLYRYDAGYPVFGVRSVERCRLVDTSCGRHYLFLQKRFSPCAGLYRTDRIGGCRVRRWLYHLFKQDT